MKTVTVTSKDGIVTIETAGFKGKACKEITAGLEHALGGEVIRDVDTEEINERERVQDQVRQG